MKPPLSLFFMSGGHFVWTGKEWATAAAKPAAPRPQLVWYEQQWITVEECRKRQVAALWAAARAQAPPRPSYAELIDLPPDDDI